jgi:hypothetical protein
LLVIILSNALFGDEMSELGKMVSAGFHQRTAEAPATAVLLGQMGSLVHPGKRITDV